MDITKRLKNMEKEIKKYTVKDKKESTLFFDSKSRKYYYQDKSQIGELPFERCIEVPWLIDKVGQIIDIRNKKLFDFGCNKASYIISLKEKYNLTTYGIDLKKDGKNFVDIFYKGMYNNSLYEDISKDAPYCVVSAISSIEHAGCKWHPNVKKITNYQLSICKDMINISDYFFLSVPYGERPGWAKDASRNNLYQFNEFMLSDIEKFAQENNKKYLEEFYLFNDGYWISSDKESCNHQCYRPNKQGASAIALISIF